MKKNLAVVKFIYINEFEFKEDFEVKHSVGSTLITKDFLDKMIQSDLLDHYQVFSLGEGVLLMYDLLGNVYLATPSSGLIDCHSLLTIFLRKESLGDRTGYSAWWEFYRVTESDIDYGVNIFFDSETITLWYKKQKVTFVEKEFINGLLDFSKEIIDWYDNKYPLFKKSAIRNEILELKKKVKDKYFTKHKI